MVEWRPIPGWEDRYEVSNDGRIRSVTITSRRGDTRQGRERAACTAAIGYLMVPLYRDGKQVPMLVHRAVALAFIGPPPYPKAQVDHVDGDRTNNRDTNLRWASAAEQRAHQCACAKDRECPQHPPVLESTVELENW